MAMRRSQLKRVWVLLLAVSVLIGSLGITPKLSYAAEPQTVVYEFSQIGLDGALGTPAGFVLEGQTNEYPLVAPLQGIGIGIQSTLSVPSRTVQLPVPASGTYEVYLKGYQDAGSGIGELRIDGVVAGFYDFYNVDSKMGPELKIGKVNLKTGNRKLTFTVVDKNESSIWYYMQPSILKLVELTPELASVAVTAEERLFAVDDTAQLQVSGLLSNDAAADLTAASIVYESSAPSVISVDQNGVVNALQLGSATIKATVTMNGVVKEGSIELRVISGLDRIEMSLDQESIYVGGQAKATLLAYATDDTSFDLEGIPVTFTSLDPSVANVDSNGVVVGKSSGRTVIRVSVISAGVEKSDSREIEVTVPPQTFVYEFSQIGLDGASGTPAGFVLEGQTNEYPLVAPLQGIGIGIQSTLSVPSRTVQLPVPASGTYEVYLKGYQDAGSGIGELRIDGVVAGFYDFYNVDSKMGPELKIGKVNLKTGNRKLTFTVVDKNENSIWYYMQPSILKLVELTPELASVAVTAEERLFAVDDTAQLQVSGLLSNDAAADLTAASIIYESSAPSVISVDQNGVVNALQLGSATIKATVTMNGVVKEGSIDLRVISALDRVVMSVDQESLRAGRHTYVTLRAYDADDTSIDLDGIPAQFVSSNPAVAAVDSNGIVVAKAPGRTTISASVTTLGVEKSDSQEIEVVDKQIIPQDIPVSVDKWGIIRPVAGALQTDGLLNEESWNTSRTLTNFVTAYTNQPSELQTEVKILYDEDHLYFGLKGELSTGVNATESEVMELYIRPKGQKMFTLMLPIDGEREVVSEHGSGVNEITGFTAEVNKSQTFWTYEVAIPLESIGLTGIGSGSELQINIVRHQIDSAPVSSWFPLKTTAFWDNIHFYTNSNREGRFGKLYTDHIPEEPLIGSDKLLTPWYPDRLSLTYLGFTSKRIVIPAAEFDASSEQLQLKWITPSGITYMLDAPTIERSGDQLSIEFAHPQASEEGSYYVQMTAHSTSSTDARIALVSFDREDMIQAGDRTLNEPDYTAPPTESVHLTPTSAEVQQLLDLIPPYPGIFWAGLPDQPGMHPDYLFNWDPAAPDQLTSPYSDLIYPNAHYPEDKVLTVVNGKGETVEYPYYEEGGKKYFITAHLWYKKRDYVMNQVERLAVTDPAGAARILYKFAQVYEGYVPVNDTVWDSRPLSSVSGPPNPYNGGMWEWWHFMDLRSLNRLSRAYGMMKSTDVFERLSQQVGENVRAKIVDEMFVPSVEFVRTYATLYTNMDYHIWQGLLEMGKAIDRPDYVHDAMERLTSFVSSQYLFDGFWKEVSMSYHAQSTGGSELVAGMMNGWTDPEGFVSQRTGKRLENVNTDNNFPSLKKSRDLLKALTYPDGKYVPLQDTWASEGQANPINRGSLLQPAAGIARLTLGQGEQQSQLYMTFTTKYDHNHFDPLNLNLYSQGQELIPDLGYTHTKYRHWATSTMGHNTVVVDSKDMEVNDNSKHGGSVKMFVPIDDTVKVMEARQENSYPGVTEYSRQPWYITFPGDAGDEGYVLDIFRVSGGSRHEYTLQGDANRDAAFETDMVTEDYGPYLLPEGQEVVLPDGETSAGSAGGEYYGYIYVRDVKQAELSGDQYSMTLVTKENGADRSRLQITGLLEPGQNELFLGRSPSIRNTRVSNIDTNDRADEFTMPKFVLRREGDNLRSTFVTALEPYAAGASASIQKVERLELDQGEEGAVAVAVTYGNTKDIILSSPNQTGTPLIAGTIRLDGKTGFIRLENGIVTKMMLIDGTGLAYEDMVLSGDGPTVGGIQQVLRKADGDSYDAFVTSAEISADVQGQYIVVSHPDGTSHGYLIQNVIKDSEQSIIQIDGEPGFDVYPDGSSQMSFFPGTKWTGEHTFRISNVNEINDPTPNRSTISPTTGSFNKKTSVQSDVTTTLVLNGNTLSDIRNGVTALIPGTDYTISGDTVTIKKEYLAQQQAGTTILTFTFSSGGNQTMTIAIIDDLAPELDMIQLGAIPALRIGETAQVVVTAVYSDATTKDVTAEALFDSSIAGVASVSASGLVKAVSQGKAVITARIGDKAANTPVTVLPSDPGKPSSSPAPSPLISNPVVDPSPVVPKKNDLQPDSDGNITVALDEGNPAVSVPHDALAAAKQLTVMQGDASVTLSKNALEQIMLHMKSSGTGSDNQLHISLNASWGIAEEQAIARAGEQAFASLTAASKVYDFQMYAGLAGENFESPVTVSIAFDPQADVGLLGVYMLEDNGKLVYVGGKIKDGRIEAELPGPRKVVVLVYNKTFDDVPADHWANRMLKEMSARQVVQGVSNTEFKPSQEVTRAEFAALLVRILGVKPAEAQRFEDVDPSAWYAGIVSAAVAAGLVEGTDGATFEPDRTITREEMAVMLVRAYIMIHGSSVSTGRVSGFADRDQVSEWALESLDLAVQVGLLSGRGDNQFAPKALTNRAEAANAVFNLLK